MAPFKLIVGRGRGDIDGLMSETLKFLKFQRTVVKCSRQTETVVDKIHLTGKVSAIHGTYLRHGDMALVYDGEEVLGKIVKQTEGAHPGLAPVEVAAVVLYAGAVTHFAHHFDVIGHALLQTARLQFASLFEEVSYLFAEVKFYLCQRRGHACRGGDKDIGREHLE